MEHLKDSQFNDFITNSDVPVLVDFWATWCMPCKMMEPVLEELNKEMGDKIKIGKMNIDENHLTPEKYGVMSIPNFILFNKGEIVENIVGAVPKKQLIDVIKKHI